MIAGGGRAELARRATERAAARLAATPTAAQGLRAAFKSGEAPVPNLPLLGLCDGARIWLHDLLGPHRLLVVDFFLALGPRSSFPVVAVDA